MSGLFVTGTDTDCGKTRVSLALIHALQQSGLRVAPFKPVAAGAEKRNGELRNGDALELIAAAGGDWEYDLVNPYCLEPPVSPHVAAREAGLAIRPAPIQAAFDVLQRQADIVLVEGAGGWLVPLREDWSVEDMVRMLGLPVVLVVGLRLGCLNHARLSLARIRSSGVAVAGWVGSVIDPGMLRLQENIASLHALLEAPCLGVLPHLEAADSGAGHLDATALLDALQLSRGA